MLLSIVIPVYGADYSIRELVERISNSVEFITSDYEILLINDASPDNSWQAIESEVRNSDKVVGINLSRNFGQHRAISAGLSVCKGDWAVVMDCDLQDLPEDIPLLFEKAIEGFDVVFGRRVKRDDGFFKKLSSKIFYKVYDYFTGHESDHSIANFSVISRKVINSYNSMPEQSKTYGLSISWLGFKRENIDINHARRPEGKSSYTFKKLLSLAIDTIVSQSNKPLKVSIFIGFLISSISMLFGLFFLLKYFFYGVSVEGWTSVIVSIYFVFGILMANLGVLGLYIGKTFDESKNRPRYVIDTLITKENISLDIDEV